MDLSSNYFELFGLPQKYEVDRTQLSEKYRMLQQQFHPDRFVNGSEQERRLSLQMASRINEGSRVLRDPIARARYLLELEGVDLGTDSQTLRDPEFLMEQMELRETLEAARQGSDPTAELDQFTEQMDRRIANYGAIFSTQWQNNSEQAHITVQQMQFFSRLAHQAESMADDLI
ncbi:MAG: Fe-S protein assembly co-chaperone HscB [Gammaproteobacteria bacterium]|jgi:molecular chaperone HscB|nr:Fe-S protein assembly co-chaperone HscB [Gammaproteobacteria bacterium]MBT3489556.1 Fe-S protein assembly co-chaperone HscB [Gammaproteobacteria bacterium]MBT3717466.1 Fe-S protein assembly co-chaperone HscB [Gammaproteobacteria bacterium]MBT3845071.1 Fe-S protein assembly co-chaperone HscB [Gammaproteobacteria bacterium]MBT3893092.1 Fe-S protein assembly co-chaperone HscB [Gammaproteobacteria bacterium]